LFAGTDRGVFMSSDRGVNWVSRNDGISDKDVWALGYCGNYLLAGTNGYGIWVSPDNGKNWEPRDNGLENYTVRSILVLGTVIYSGFQGGGVYRSVDFGLNWTKMVNGMPVSASVVALDYYKNNIYAATGGYLYVSSDNAQSWSVSNNGFMGVYPWSLAVKEPYVFAGTWGGGVYYNFDNGVNWEEIPNKDLANLFISSVAVNDTIVFAGTYGAGVWKRTISEIMGTNELQITDYRLQIYPNPASERLTINYQLSTNSHVSIKVYDIMGREVDESGIMNYELGINKINYDVSKLLSGVYFVKLSTDNALKVVKFVKNK
jgi:hypothetical protein